MAEFRRSLGAILTTYVTLVLIYMAFPLMLAFGRAFNGPDGEIFFAMLHPFGAMVLLIDEGVNDHWEDGKAFGGLLLFALTHGLGSLALYFGGRVLFKERSERD